jgi:hypothetical protein
VSQTGHALPDVLDVPTVPAAVSGLLVMTGAPPAVLLPFIVTAPVWANNRPFTVAPMPRVMVV